MKDHEIVDQILERIRTLYPSYGIAPYSVSADAISEPVIDILPGIQEDFSHIVSISVWNDYDKQEVIDYLKHSKEYLSPSSAERMEHFLSQNLNKIYNELGVTSWKILQSDMVFGLVIGCVRSLGHEPLSFRVTDLLPEVKKQLDNLYSTGLTLQYIVLI
ncbi:hypothetical protein [Sphingobacterium daejeonense]|uniref:hypothetical protein n=1 Tax=Sphingobacterium daejeonense TaxID=371142 RepID=UPI0010C3C3AD|nr:hypothetical protein [Sphingobacterium daejeonense]VTP91752.1 Uncharacterised protein [Sphingobacterium daejeonense]